VEVSANEKAFYKLIDAALTGATGLHNDVRQFAWTGANCLGITDIEDPQDVAVLLMLLRERRLNEAARGRRYGASIHRALSRHAEVCFSARWFTDFATAAAHDEVIATAVAGFQFP
jgi:hypothetical protein